MECILLAIIVVRHNHNKIRQREFRFDKEQKIPIPFHFHIEGGDSFAHKIKTTVKRSDPLDWIEEGVWLASVSLLSVSTLFYVIHYVIH